MTSSLVETTERTGYTYRMKRVNLMLPEALLNEALRLSGEGTYSRVVGRALEDFVRRIKSRRILELAGSGEWEGELAVIRDDRPRRKRQGRRGATH